MTKQTHARDPMAHRSCCRAGAARREQRAASLLARHSQMRPYPIPEEGRRARARLHKVVVLAARDRHRPARRADQAADDGCDPTLALRRARGRACTKSPYSPRVTATDQSAAPTRPPNASGAASASQPSTQPGPSPPSHACDALPAALAMLPATCARCGQPDVLHCRLCATAWGARLPLAWSDNQTRRPSAPLHSLRQAQAGPQPRPRAGLAAQARYGGATHASASHPRRRPLRCGLGSAPARPRDGACACATGTMVQPFTSHCSTMLGGSSASGSVGAGCGAAAERGSIASRSSISFSSSWTASSPCAARRRWPGCPPRLTWAHSSRRRLRAQERGQPKQQGKQAVQALGSPCTALLR